MSNSQQPSNVSTADTPERPQNVFTEEPIIAAARKAEKEAASGDKPGQTSGDSDKPPLKSKRRPHRDRPAERRISKLTKQLDDSQTENAALKERVEALEKRPAEPKPEPQLRDFKTPREYAKAFNAWEDEQKPAPKPKPKPKAKADPPPDKAAQQAHADDLAAFAKDGKERLGEPFTKAFTDKDSGMAVNQDMGEYMFDSDLGPEIYLHLYEHPELSKELFFSDKESLIERLEELEKNLAEPGPTTTTDDSKDDKPKRDASGRFVKKGDAEPEPKPKTGTKSSAPPAPGESEKGEVVPDADLEKADMDDYSATRRKQYANRGERP